MGRLAASASPMAIWILAAVAIVWFLRTARTLLIPIALAVLISYALEPFVAWLERRHVKRAVGSALVLLAVVGAAVGAAYALRDDAMQLVAAAPKAAERAREIVTSQLGADAGALATATGALGGTASSGGNSVDAQPAGTSGGATSSPAPRIVRAVVGFSGHIVVIVFLVFFLLLSGHLVKDRLVEVTAAPEQRRTVTTIVDDVNGQIQRYLLVLLLTAAIVSLATWLVLAWMGVEHAVMWGLLAGVFNSIPYFGPVVVSGGLFVVGIVQAEGIEQALWMSGAALVITSLEGWLLTPPLMGKVERMSALTVFLGLLLWTWMWGPWGTVLAVPMLAIVKSVADHVRPLRPVSRLMAP